MVFVALAVGRVLGLLSQMATDRLAKVSPARVEEAAVSGH